MADTNRILTPMWYPSPGSFDEPFIQIDDPWFQPFINGMKIPGVSNVEVSRSHSLNVKASAGKHFATVTDQGYKPSDVIITTTLWTPQQWEIYQLNILAIVEPDPGAKYALPTVTIDHPGTAARGITSITIETITGPKDKGKGIREFQWKCLQFQKSDSKATNTPKAAGIAPFANALTGKGQKPSDQKVPAHGNS